MSIKLLVADDSITIQKVIGIIFGGDDYSLTVVDNGKTAIEKAREICPDVLLIDALMPGMTGYEVSEAVRATPALANKPILILTGSFEPFDEDKAKKCGADDFLAKPFESQQIISKVKELAELGMAREKAAMAAHPPVTPLSEQEYAHDFITSAETFTAPAFVQQAATPPTTAPSDIWGAFTPEVESAVTPPMSAAAPVAESAPITAPFEFSVEPDVFAIVNEESDSQLVQPAAATGSSMQSTGSQWIPVEEHTFEFEEETVPELPKTTSAEHAAPIMPSSFGDISFEDDEPPQPSTVAAPASVQAAETAAPAFNSMEPDFISFDKPSAAFTPQMAAFEEPPQPVHIATPDLSALVPPPVAEAPAPAAAPAALTEDQLKAAISSASKEVIERIVWEVVPDLAEALIKEAIRKIKEGL